MDKVYAQGLLDKRARVFEQMKDISDRQPDPAKRSEEDEQSYERANTEYDELTRQIDTWIADAKREEEHDKAREALAAIAQPDRRSDRPEGPQMSAIERWMRFGDTEGLPTWQDGNQRGVEVDLKPAARFIRAVRDGMDRKEARAIYTDGGASAGSIVVPEEWALKVYEYIEAESAVRGLSYVFERSSGAPIHFEKVATHGVGTQVVAQGTAIGGTDPVFGTITLNSFRFGQLVKVSNTAARDTGFDLLDFVGRNIGRGVGRKIDTALVTGDGAAGPNGIITAASVGATTGGSLIALGGGAATTFTQNLDCLIQLQHSVVAGYRNKGAFVMHDSTAGTVRRVKDGGAGTVGAYLWVASTTFDPVTGNRMPDSIFGNPVYTDVNFGTNGSSVKPVAFGDWSAYYVGDVGGLRLSRSDDRYFDTDEIGFRGLMETDADLIDTGAVKVLQQAP